MLFPILTPLGTGSAPDARGRPFGFEVVTVLVLFVSAGFAAWCVWHNLTTRDTFPLQNRWPDIWDTEDACLTGIVFGFMGAAFAQFGLIGVFLGCRLLFHATTRGLQD